MINKICIIGGGYVGLPLAVALSEYYSVIVLTKTDIHAQELSSGIDRTQSFSSDELKRNPIVFTSVISDASDATVFIVTVPTPIYADYTPDLSPVEDATKSIASVLKKEDIVIYESTVYIGCTEEFCVPILEAESGLVFNQDFYCGFSPERINPADTERTIHTVMKIVAGSTSQVTEVMKEMYGKIVYAGLHVAPAIKVAEASKLIENIQRDVNIALMNELSQLFRLIGIDTNDVITAASTKWNFIPYHPGLVGGHCIGVDPYYMLYNGERQKIDLPLIALSRTINNDMVDYVINSTLALLKERAIEPLSATVLMLGITFKENCPDIRNSQSARIFSKLKEKVKKIDLYDPIADTTEVNHVYEIQNISIDALIPKQYDAIIITVAHTPYKLLNLQDLLKDQNGIIIDLKGLLPKEQSDFRL